MITPNKINNNSLILSNSLAILSVADYLKGMILQLRLSQVSNKVHMLHVVAMPLNSHLFHLFSDNPLYLVISLIGRLFILWNPMPLDLAIVSLCHLTCSSTACVSYKVLVRSV